MSSCRFPRCLMITLFLDYKPNGIMQPESGSKVRVLEQLVTVSASLWKQSRSQIKIRREHILFTKNLCKNASAFSSL